MFIVELFQIDSLSMWIVLAKQFPEKRFAAHADAAVNFPHGNRDSGFAQRPPPCTHMLVVAVDERSVQVEQYGGIVRLGERAFCRRVRLSSSSARRHLRLSLAFRSFVARACIEVAPRIAAKAFGIHSVANRHAPPGISQQASSGTIACAKQNR